jgi:nitrite reductase/ring-hydroxylating ferredoxin subunit/uncharacterized membrane protein
MAVESFKSAARFTDAEVIGRQAWLDSTADALQQGVRSLVEWGGEPARTFKDALHGTWLGHSLHPVLTDVPIGAWTAGLLFDMVGLDEAADRLLELGVVAAVPTALTGAADWSDTDGKQRRVGLVHAVLNSAALSLFLASIAARRAGNRPAGVALSATGYALAAGSAYLGGELVYSQGTAVSRAAWDPDVPEFQVAARASDLVDGQLAQGEITVEGQRLPLVLLKRGPEVLALGDVCSHWGGPLHEGKVVEGDCVECPWHGSTFDLRDGSVTHGPATVPQPRYEARLRDGNVEVRRLR